MDDDRAARLSELDADQLDDETDREELRRRFEMLLQELRVVLPGVQILLGFLLTAPVSERFGDLDGTGRTLYGVALTATATSTVALLGPTILHRLGERRARADRLIWSVRLFIIGVGLLAVGLVAGLWCVARFVFGDGAMWAVLAPVLAALAVSWLALPVALRRAR